MHALLAVATAAAVLAPARPAAPAPDEQAIAEAMDDLARGSRRQRLGWAAVGLAAGAAVVGAGVWAVGVNDPGTLAVFGSSDLEGRIVGGTILATGAIITLASAAPLVLPSLGEELRDDYVAGRARNPALANLTARGEVAALASSQRSARALVRAGGTLGLVAGGLTLGAAVFVSRDDRLLVGGIGTGLLLGGAALVVRGQAPTSAERVDDRLNGGGLSLGLAPVRGGGVAGIAGAF